MRHRGTERLKDLPQGTVLMHENNTIQTGFRIYALVFQAPETRLASYLFPLLLLLARMVLENVNKIMLFLFLKLASGWPFHRESNDKGFILRLKSITSYVLASFLVGPSHHSVWMKRSDLLTWPTQQRPERPARWPCKLRRPQKVVWN